ncbi:hypothetical protein WJX73_006747, partial [Symbiochloris irregularis]
RTEAKERKKRKLSTTPARNPKPKRLHESHVESNEVSPLDDAADEESLANDGAIEDVEVDGVAQMAVMEGGADSAEWAADSAPPPEHLQQLEQQQQRTAAARQPPPETILESFEAIELRSLLVRMARQPNKLAREHYGEVQIAYLRWRESEYCRSSTHRFGYLGSQLYRALLNPQPSPLPPLHKMPFSPLVAGGDHRGRASGGSSYEEDYDDADGSDDDSLRRKLARSYSGATKGGRRKKPAKRSLLGGVSVPEPVLGLTAEALEYTDRVPSTKQSFMDALNAFYESRNARTNPEVRVKGPLDLHALFVQVANRGGYDAVTVGRHWSAVGAAVHPDLALSSTVLRKQYQRFLLAYERQLSSGCPAHTVQQQHGRKRKSFDGAVAAKAALAEPLGKRVHKVKAEEAGVKVEEGRALHESAQERETSESTRKRKLSMAAAKHSRAGKPRSRPQVFSEESEQMSGGLDSEAGPRPMLIDEDSSSEDEYAAVPRHRPTTVPSKHTATIKRRPGSRDYSALREDDASAASPQAKQPISSAAIQKFDNLLEQAPPRQIKRSTSDGRRHSASSSQQGLARGNAGREIGHRGSDDSAMDGPDSIPVSLRNMRDTLVLQFAVGTRLPSRAQVMHRLRKHNVIESDANAVRVLGNKYCVIARFPNERCARGAQEDAAKQAAAWFAMPQGSVKSELRVWKAPQIPHPPANPTNPTGAYQQPPQQHTQPASTLPPSRPSNPTATALSAQLPHARFSRLPNRTQLQPQAAAPVRSVLPSAAVQPQAAAAMRSVLPGLAVPTQLPTDPRIAKRNAANGPVDPRRKGPSNLGADPAQSVRPPAALSQGSRATASSAPHQPHNVPSVPLAVPTVPPPIPPQAPQSAPVAPQPAEIYIRG